MSSTPEPKEVKACMVCKATGDDRVLLCGEHREKKVWVCVRCLPMLIHGEH
ncbi:MAG: hypothetical protein HY673_24905 [Chloroflexi bacterium]|nr:hypothetical protein [Chloroflexota bacterium]